MSPTMSLRKKNRKDALNRRDSKKFLIAAAITVGVLMLLMFLVFSNM